MRVRTKLDTHARGGGGGGSSSTTTTTTTSSTGSSRVGSASAIGGGGDCDGMSYVRDLGEDGRVDSAALRQKSRSVSPRVPCGEDNFSQRLHHLKARGASATGKRERERKKATHTCRGTLSSETHQKSLYSLWRPQFRPGQSRLIYFSKTSVAMTMFLRTPDETRKRVSKCFTRSGLYLMIQGSQ